MQYKIFNAANNASGHLNSGISAADLTIVLKAGEGATFPVTSNGVADSLGDDNTLNCTGISLTGVKAGQFIYNITDGSYAYITAVAADVVLTSDLKGGTANVWGNGDEWAVNMFVATLSKKDSGGIITAYECAIIKQRAADTLTVLTGGRGHKGTGAKIFAADDYCEVFVEQSALEGLIEGVGEAHKEIKNIEDTKADISYVNDLFNTQNWKVACAAATTAPGTLATDFEDGDTIDGVVLATGNRVLIKNQADPIENGIYTVEAAGAPTRATDFDAADEITGAIVTINAGTENLFTTWICVSVDPVPDVDAIEFAQFTTNRDVATQADAEAGSNNTKIMTPLRSRQGLMIGANKKIPYADSAKTNGIDWNDVFNVSDGFGLSAWQSLQVIPESMGVNLSGSGSKDYTLAFNITNNNTAAASYHAMLLSWFTGKAYGETTNECIFQGYITGYNTEHGYCNHFYGIGSALTALIGGAGTFIGFKYTGADKKLYTSTGVDCGVMVTQRFYKIKVHLTAAAIYFYLNDALVATQTTGLPTVDTVIVALGVGQQRITTGYMSANFRTPTIAFKIS